MTAFTSCGRIEKNGLICDASLNAQLRGHNDALMTWRWIYGPSS
jgi:hypothetical protein